MQFPFTVIVIELLWTTGQPWIPGRFFSFVVSECKLLFVKAQLAQRIVPLPRKDIANCRKWNVQVINFLAVLKEVMVYLKSYGVNLKKVAPTTYSESVTGDQFSAYHKLKP